MKALASYVMRGRLQAVLAATGLTVLSLLLPPLSYLSGAIIGLVTLRIGVSQGLVLALICTALVGGISALALDNTLYAAVFLAAVWAPVWIVSAVLRRTISLSTALMTAAGLSMVAVVGLHVLVPDTVEFWRQTIQRLFEEAWSLLSADERSEMLNNLSQIATAALGATFLLSIVLSLYIARWWQAALYNPGGFGQEFYALRLNRAGTVVTGVLVVAAFVERSFGSMSSDLLVVMVTLYSFAGLSLVHDWIRTTKTSAFWLILIYVLLLFAAPQMLAVMAMAGIGDAWGDFRKRFAANKSA